MAIKPAIINYTVAPGTSYVITYKKSTDTAWIVPPGNPTNLSPFTINGLETDVVYDLRIQNNCGVISLQFVLTGEVETIWVEGDFICEQDEPFTLDDTYTGFSSPLAIFFDETSQRFYVADADDALGVFWWFDPNTIIGFPSATHIPGSITQDINTVVIDKVNRRIISAGDNSSGALVLNIATDTVSTLPYGTNVGGLGGNGRRAPLALSNTKLYAFSKFPDEFVRIYNRTSLAFETQIPFSSIPSQTTYINQGFGILFVGAEIWVYATARANGAVARYNSDFTTLNGTITLPGIATSISSQYWQNAYYDQTNNKVYIGDMGSKRLFVIDSTTGSIISNTPLIDFRGKPFCDFNIIKSDLDGMIYVQARGITALNDPSPNFKLYRVNSATGQIEFMYPDTPGANLTLRTGTNEQWAIQPGLVVWSMPNTGYNTDGVVLKYI